MNSPHRRLVAAPRGPAASSPRILLRTFFVLSFVRSLGITNPSRADLSPMQRPVRAIGGAAGNRTPQSQRRPGRDEPVLRVASEHPPGRAALASHNQPVNAPNNAKR